LTKGVSGPPPKGEKAPVCVRKKKEILPSYSERKEEKKKGKKGEGPAKANSSSSKEKELLSLQEEIIRSIGKERKKHGRRLPLYSAYKKEKIG